MRLFFAAIGSHHLEYGFPSTHSTNSVSIALFLYDLLHRAYYPAASVAKSTVDPSWLEWNATSGLLPAMEVVAEAPATEALISRTTYILGIGVLLFYVFSIVYGRLYTGMHSFTDCAVGIALGVFVGASTLVAAALFLFLRERKRRRGRDSTTRKLTSSEGAHALLLVPW